MVLLAHGQGVLHAAPVGRHDGAVDVQVAVGDGTQDVVGVLVDHHAGGALAGAVVHADHRAAVGLDRLADLVDDAADRAAGDEDALGVRRDGPLAGVVGRLARGHRVLDLRREVVNVEVERAREHRAHELDAAHRRRLLGLQLEHAELRRTQAVAATSCGAQVVVGDGDAVEPLEALLEQAALFAPALALVGTLAALRQVQDVHRLEVGEQLIHLLFAVAGGLADDQIREVREGALLRVGEAVGRLDERAEVRRQDLLGVGDDLVGRAAQAHRRGTGRVDDLHGRVAAQHAHQAISRLLEVFDADKRGLALLVELLERARQRLGLELGHDGSSPVSFALP